MGAPQDNSLVERTERARRKCPSVSGTHTVDFPLTPFCFVLVRDPSSLLCEIWELSDRHCRPQVWSESFDRLRIARSGKFLREGSRASPTERELRKEKDTT